MEMEDIWVRRELGDELFLQCNQPGFDLVYVRSDSQILPGATYCRCDIYVDVEDSKQATLFALKYNKALLVKRGQRDNEYW
jgi:hypothetical protein